VNGFVDVGASSSSRHLGPRTSQQDRPSPTHRRRGRRHRCITPARERLHYDRAGTRQLRQRRFCHALTSSTKVTTLVTKLLLPQCNVINANKNLEGNQVRTFDARF
jgi:hypothetical protein